MSPLRAEAKVRKIMKTSRSPLASSCDYNSIHMASITFHFKKSYWNSLAFYTWPDLNAKLLRKFKHKLFNAKNSDFLN